MIFTSGCGETEEMELFLTFGMILVSFTAFQRYNDDDYVDLLICDGVTPAG